MIILQIFLTLMAYISGIAMIIGLLEPIINKSNKFIWWTVSLVGVIVCSCSVYSIFVIDDLIESKYETCIMEIQDGKTLELTYDPEGGKVMSSKVVDNE